MLYHAYEMTHAAVGPMRAAARLGRESLRSSNNPFADSYGARASAAAFDMFINATRRYAKPEFGIETTIVDDVETAVSEEIVQSLPFCNLLHFKRDTDLVQPKVLIIAPMSGHYATLLRGTVKSMLPDHDVYITDWTDARDVPLTQGGFDLDDYVDYLIGFCQLLAKNGQRPAVMAVCQPGVPMLVAAALMAKDNDPARPASITLMGSPVDTACNPKAPNDLATGKPLSWFENNVVVTVPWPNAGFMRKVYPGFLQLSGFMSMNVDKHVDAHKKQFQHLIAGDGDNVDAHRRFYDEYMAVMDLSADFYLQTIDRVFQQRLLAKGEYMYRDQRVDLAAINDIALQTIEGEKDDITGLGQTEAAHRLTPNIPAKKRQHFVQENVGHYGVFNGSKWREQIQPKVAKFIKAMRSPVGKK